VDELEGLGQSSPEELQGICLQERIWILGLLSQIDACYLEASGGVAICTDPGTAKEIEHVLTAGRSAIEPRPAPT